MSMPGSRETAPWRDRPVFVTGATGLLGSWLVRRLTDLGADVVCLVRDWIPRSELVAATLVDRVRVVRGDVCDQALLERVLGECEIVDGVSSGCTGHRGRRQPEPGLDARHQHPGNVGAARGVPPKPSGPSDRRRLVR